jgi:predicted DNA binding CopG/RHH family protein
MTKSKRRTVPKFSTEAQEAKWWYDHREMVEKNLRRAMADGTAERGAAHRLVREARASRNITIRMAEADLQLARQQAEKRGLPYQTYMKSVLHQALTERERRSTP